MRVAVRVDATSQMGTGHVMRCLTLVNALAKEGASIRFICREILPDLEKLILNSGHELVNLQATASSVSSEALGKQLPHSHWLHSSQQQDAADTIVSLSDSMWDWMVVDHYALDHEWESAVKTVVDKIFVIDDLADRHHDCCILLDQNHYRDREYRYKKYVPENCKLLLGSRYALLRKEFSELHQKAVPRAGDVRKILVFLGGVDAQNYTLIAINALANLSLIGVVINVVIGSQHPYQSKIVEACNQYGFSCHIQTSEMPRLMAEADLAIGAGGTATWERCCLGLPTITVSVAANQSLLVNDSAYAGLLYAVQATDDLENALTHHIFALIYSSPLRTIISMNCLDAVDGLGVSRVVSEFGGQQIELRRAAISDSENIWSWRNTPEIRAVSLSQAHIPFDAHQLWYERTLIDPARILLIGTNRGVDLGVVRFDLEHNHAEISIYLIPGLEGNGVGGHLLRAAEVWLKINKPHIECVRADVLGDNLRSQVLFKKSGYTVDLTTYVKRVH